jgi:hypothetical protein
MKRPARLHWTYVERLDPRHPEKADLSVLKVG